MILSITMAALLAPSLASHPTVTPNWIEGCWVTKGSGTEEHWARAGDHHLFGYNVVRRTGDVVFFEQLRIESSDTESVFFAYPRGVGPTMFKEVARTDTSITFENPEHDDPQRIVYTRDGVSMDVSVSLLDGTRKRTWMYTACPTEP